MDDNEKTNDKNNRKITYQVGWKKGSIQVDEDGHMIKPKPFGDRLLHSSSIDTVNMDLINSRRILEKVLWRRLPFIPISAAGILFWLLPIISLGLTFFLVYALLTYPGY